MKKSKFTEEQIAYVLRQAEAGTPGPNVWRQMGCGPGSTVNEPWIAAPHAALSSNAQP